MMREVEPVALFRHNSDGTFCVETSVYCTGEPVEVCHFWRVAFVAGRDGNEADFDRAMNDADSAIESAETMARLFTR